MDLKRGVGLRQAAGVSPRTLLVIVLSWKRSWWLLVAALVQGVVILTSCSSIERTVMAPPAIEGATYVGNKACYDCHTNIVRNFPSSPHARLHSAELGMKGQSGCESCHGPGSRHIEAGGGRGRFIVNPQRDPQPCLECHLQTHAEFRMPQHHPVLEGKLTCVQCHDPHGSEIFKPARMGLAMSRLNESCGECHREQARPHVYEHDAMREGCTTCHVPHGSVNAKMLVERDLNLCLKCHAQIQGVGVPPGQLVIGTVNHTTFISRGACWSSGCHTAIHGSNVSPLLHY